MLSMVLRIEQQALLWERQGIIEAASGVDEFFLIE